MLSRAVQNTFGEWRRSRRWQLTLNNAESYSDVKSYLTSLKSFRFLYSCKENAPTTGHLHIHIYAVFNKAVELAVSKCCGAHLERCRGDHKSNMKYIAKDGNILDMIGDEPEPKPFPETAGELRKVEYPDELDWKMLRTWTLSKQIDQSRTRNDFYKPNIKIIYI